MRLNQFSVLYHHELDRAPDPCHTMFIPNETKQMRIDVKCYGAPWENTTTDLDKAYDLAYDLSEEYQCDVDLRYNETGIIFTTVSNY
jgi:hypothetical protein